MALDRLSSLMGPKSNEPIVVVKSEPKKATGFAQVMKSNPYHDQGGQFTSKEKDADGQPSGHTKESVRSSMTLQSPAVAGGAYNVRHGGSSVGHVSKVTDATGKTAWGGVHGPSNTVVPNSKTQGEAVMHVAGAHAKHLNDTEAAAKSKQESEVAAAHAAAKANGREHWTKEDYSRESEKAYANIGGLDKHMQPHYTEMVEGTHDQVRITPVHDAAGVSSHKFTITNPNRGTTHYQTNDPMALHVATGKALQKYMEDHKKASDLRMERMKSAFNLMGEGELRHGK